MDIFYFIDQSENGRQSPPIMPRTALPSRDKNAPIVGESLQSSPISTNSNQNNKKQYSLDTLLPLEKHTDIEQPEARSPIQKATKEPSITISPAQSSTPAQLARFPSVIPKNVITLHSSYNFEIIPIECKYHFRCIKQRYTFEAIKIHQEFFKRKSKMLENERENKLHTFFPEHQCSQIVSYVKSITDKTLENKKKSDQRRLNNLLLDQMPEKVIREINHTATQTQQQYIKTLKENS
ncbi:unnamed protein product [Rotaria sp. Silwood2]|nr:unnamed protein product [Rotaria sp. Silwood2]CAF3377495.1 unnamed protein product [Rotaria sp. Silwood2]CAF3459040.1 unnamed protein product [Rotaria sp. Silwood2]CAF4199644.1 unnamed protein product [Rotaria sp. Silwood2]CAF4331656.1 unnamed protein product [Rotaria sp. Silwood2]